jgi:hypothetical protein
MDVQGKNIHPRIAKIQLSLTPRRIYTGLISHQIKIAKRGPKTTSDVKKQHMVILLRKIILVNHIASCHFH